MTTVCLTKELIDQAYANIKNRKTSAIMICMEASSKVNWMDRYICPLCKKDIIGTTLSTKTQWDEFCISGICRLCQESIFFIDQSSSDDE